MRRLFVIIAILFAAECVTAQNPRAVLKSIEEGDVIKSTERFEKIGDKSREKMPEMCLLAEAALLAMPEQSGENKMRGYEILATNIDKIRASQEAVKVFKGLDNDLETVISNIEKESKSYVASVDNEPTYLHYLEFARKGNHPDIVEIEKRLEHRRYQDAMASKSIDRCTQFLSTYPESEYRNEVLAHRTDLYYDEAMTTAEEGKLEHFIASYPDYKKIQNVELRLMEVRYRRIFSGSDLDQMKWFVELYPKHYKMAEIKQQMADIEFPTVQYTCEALEQFIAYYPEVTQIVEAKRRLCVAKVAEEGSVKHFVEYVKTNGYDRDYSTMVRNIYAHSNRFIITPDICNVTLLHFANDEGLAGYMDLEGNVVIEPKYSAERVTFGSGHYNNFMFSEFTTTRSVALVKLNGKWGAINSSGEEVIPHKYGMIALIDKMIYAIADPSKEVYDDDGGDAVGYYCDIYSLDGHQLKKNELTYMALEYQAEEREWENNLGEVMGNYLTPKYCIYYNDNGTKLLMDRDNNTRQIGWESSEGVTDNVAVAEITVNGKSGRYYINLDSNEPIKECPYERVYPMSCGLAMVYDGQKYGFINEQLELEIACKFDSNLLNTRFNCGLMVVADGVINTRGEYVSLGEGRVTGVYERGGMSYNLPGLFIIQKDRLYSVVDASGALLVELEDEYEPTIEGNYAIDSKQQRHMFKRGDEHSEQAAAAEEQTMSEAEVEGEDNNKHKI